MNTSWPIRLATESDIPELSELIPISVRQLQKPFYSESQMEAAIGPIFGVDRQLIADRTYFVVEHAGRIIGCGGWSRRRSLSGSGGSKGTDDELLNPETDAAKIRAFFVHPDFARQGVGRSIMVACEAAVVVAQFRRIEILATLAGELLYATFGYQVLKRYEMPLSNGGGLPVVLMGKAI